jgi:signal transduction histidine kinase
MTARPRHRQGHPPDQEERWERTFETTVAALPYVLLAGATVPSLLQPGQTWRDRLLILGLVAFAAAWLLAWDPRPGPRSRPGSPPLPPAGQPPPALRRPEWRRRTVPTIIYFAGMLAVAGVLTARSWFFVAFAVTGFVQAFLLLPTALAFVAVFATSVVVYTAPAGFPEPTVEAILGYVFIILLQTVLTGLFSFMGMRFTEAREQRRRLMAELEAALEENAGLHVQLLTQAREAGVLDERQRMAREIHDTLAQGLTGVITQLEAAERAHARLGEWRRHLEAARALARESLTEARRSVEALRPEPLEDARLPDAIADLARRWSEASSVTAGFEVTGEPRPLYAELEVTLFRVAQEALANVAKHARASKVGLTLSYLEDEVLLDVRDDGVGFAGRPSRPGAGGGFGLAAMAQRLRRVAGRLEVESAPGAGTAVNASVPAIPAGGS